MTAALWYAEHGFPIFPCRPRAKEPLTTHGFKDATTDAQCISEWWRQWPDANIAMATGRPSGLLVMDIDPRNGGAESLDALIAEHGSFPDTAEQATGGGGRHIIFQNPGVRVPKTVAAGIDLKADGGYIMVAPSIHPSGRPHQWDGIEGPKALLHPAPVPPWLLERILAGQNAGGTRNGATGDTTPKWAPGERNNRLASLGGTMRRRGMSLAAILSALLAENLAQCDPPLLDAEVRKIAESIASYAPVEEPGRGFDPRPAPDFASNWPEEISAAAYYGLAGELVRAILPHSEADPAALLLQFLIGFGNVIGRSAYFLAEADRHFMNLFAVIVGQTAKGRKGTSLGHIRKMLAAVDEPWSDARMMGGLASGEGLIWAVRDDGGGDDKRLLVIEPEFARVLQVCERESNTLSAIVRQAWDSGNLRILTKKETARSTEAHISIIGHITKDELNRLLTDTAAGNGFANRFLWVCAKRSKLLPEGGALDTVNFAPIIEQLQEAVNFSQGAGLVRRDERAREIWHGVYAKLSEGKPGLLGAVTSRAEAQTMRPACLYALLDCSPFVREQHLTAALEVWRYCGDSARFIFGAALGDATADEIMRALQQHSDGLARNDVRDLFHRNKSSAEIGRALGLLQEYGLARVVRDRECDGQRRPTERWFAVRV